MEKKALELLEHGLRDMYDAELRFAQALDEMVDNAHDPALADSFLKHRDQTREQATRLERAFDELGRAPEREECSGAKGLIEEYKSFVSEHGGEENGLVDAFAAGAGLKVEHYEIASYRALIDLAEYCELDITPKVLKENLAEEERAAADMQSAASALGAALAGAPIRAVAGRGISGMIDQVREGTLSAFGSARAVGKRTKSRARQQTDEAEERNRSKLEKKGSSMRSGQTRPKGKSQTKAKRKAPAKRDKRSVSGGSSARRPARSSAAGSARRGKSPAKRRGARTGGATVKGTKRKGATARSSRTRSAANPRKRGAPRGATGGKPARRKTS